MKLKCVINYLEDLKDLRVKERLLNSINIDVPIADLDVGTLYTVYGLNYGTDGGVWVYLNTVHESDYPYPYPIEMFEVVDGSIPRGWSIKFETNTSGSSISCVGFTEWIHDPRFYERLIEGDNTALALYEKWKSAFESK